jgi:hypothetical protein
MVYNTELLGFWTLSIVRYFRNYKTQRFGNWTCFRPQVRGEGTYSVGLLERSKLNHWTSSTLQVSVSGIRLVVIIAFPVG